MKLSSQSRVQQSPVTLFVFFVFSIVMTLFVLQKADQAIAEINKLTEHEVYLGR